MDNIHIIPEKPAITPNYYCTWSTQNYGRDDAETEDISVFEGDQGARKARNFLNENIVFSADGIINQFEKVRSDLYFLFDDGWDVPYNVHPDTSRYLFGSLELNEERFPSCEGAPAERLKKLNQWVKGFGWRGAGLWIAAQAVGDGKDGKLLEQDELEKYWRQRVKWTEYAGIEYWKVDWGVRGGDIAFRQMLTRIAREEAPNLLVEHCRGCGPLNDSKAPWDAAEETGNGRYRSWGNALQETLNVLLFSDILRTYDVTPHLSTATTLDRVSSILLDANVNEAALGILNCEDELYLGAALGCSFGVMRSKLFKDIHDMDYDPKQAAKCMDEVVRSVRWQKLAPAYSAGESTIFMSNEELTDTWFFRKGDTWASWVIGKEIKQSCPAIVSRGINLPKVEYVDHPPFVVASRNPNGAVSIAVLPRTEANKGIYMPTAHVELIIGDSECPIGIFGKYGSLSLLFDETIVNKRIWAQDLADDVAEDITDRITICDNQLLISGELIMQVGLKAATAGDLSDPGMVIRLMD